MSSEEKRLLTRREFGSKYKIPYLTLQYWANQGKGPAYFRVGRQALYDELDIEQYLLTCRVEPKRNITLQEEVPMKY